MTKFNRSGSGKPAFSFREVSSARLHQKSGGGNAYGGFAKIDRGDGTFRMRPTGN